MLTAEEDQLLAKLAQQVVKRRMETPAIFFLESMKPMNFVGSQVMQFFQPLVATFLPAGPFGTYDQLRALLEKRESIEQLICKIEQGKS